MNPKHIFIQYLEYIPIRILLYFVHLFPYSFSVKIGVILGHLIYLIPSLRNTVINNLTEVYKEKPLQEIKALSKKVLINFGTLCLEVMFMPKLTLEKLNKIVSFEDGSLETMKDLFSRQSGIVGITMHYGNWEFMGSAISAQGFKLNHIVRPLDNLLLDKYIESYRKLFGAGIISRKESLKEGFRVIHRKELLTFLIDQNWAIGGIYIPFMDRLAATSQGAALFCYKFRCPVVAAHTYRKDDNTHVVCLREIEVDYSIEDKEQFIYNTMLKFSQYFEKIILENPEQWMWLHPRWKSRPKDENDFIKIQYSG